MDSFPSCNRHILTVSLEDYYQGAAFRKILDRSHWARFEERVGQNSTICLRLLAKHKARATFFVSSWMAERIPAVLAAIVSQGHEIGSAGVTQRSFREMTEQELRNEARSSKQILERLTGLKVRGYRVADHRLQEKDLWALRVLAEEGYAYDSSLSPSLTHFFGNKERRFLHSIEVNGGIFHEFPLPSASIMGIKIPIAGGNYFRQIPSALLKPAIAAWTNSKCSPFVFYFRLWDLDPDQPRITAASRLSRIRHYRNSAEIPALLEYYLSTYSLNGISEYLGMAPQPVSYSGDDSLASTLVEQADKQASTNPLDAVSVVIPCYNERHSLPYLNKALRQLTQAGAGRYRFEFIFVDDGSEDKTLEMLRELFGGAPNLTIIQHAKNQGISRAILTGIEAAKTELVCSIDCDCTYDPLDLMSMIDLAENGVDCVTASPYHPRGLVKNVPSWRLFVSKCACRLYRLVLGVDLHTFTSCCRVYRRSNVMGISVEDPGFVGIAEILGKLHLKGYRIVEFPTTLAVRVLGRSKMRVLRNIPPHLRLLSRLLTIRMFGKHMAGKQDASLAIPEKISHG